jgi:hypothetical protein
MFCVFPYVKDIGQKGHSQWKLLSVAGGMLEWNPLPAGVPKSTLVKPGGERMLAPYKP